MENFREGYHFFQKYAADSIGIFEGEKYIEDVNSEITKLVKDLNKFKNNKASIDTLKGDVAEFWHAGTFNINSAINKSKNRVQVDRSNAFGSVDISGINFEEKFGLKYYKDGASSAKQQSKSIFERFNEYKSQGGKDNIDIYLENRGYNIDTVLNDPVYSGQHRVIPTEQMEEAVAWLARKIEKESKTRPEQVERYKETLRLLTDRLRDKEGNESIVLTEKDARNLAQISKEGNVTSEELNLNIEELIKYSDILKQAYKAGLTSATISMILKVAPGVLNALIYLIKTGEIDKEKFEKVGFAAVTGAGEGFIRGTISAAITASCKAGLCGNALKVIDSSIIGAVSTLTMNTMKNCYRVSIGEMSRRQVTSEMIEEMFITTCALTAGSISQSFIEIPVLGYMLGSFVGSLAGTIIYSSVYTPVISFCIDTGFTMFGLVEQDYKLSEEILKEVGIEIFEYDKFDYNKFELEQFEFSNFSQEVFEPANFNFIFLRRGVIGVNCIGYV